MSKSELKGLIRDHANEDFLQLHYKVMWGRRSNQSFIDLYQVKSRSAMLVSQQKRLLGLYIII